VRPAVFLDRDGTLLDDPPPGYLRDPDRIRLLPGAGAAIRQWGDAGYAIVVVTNQAGIARGLISWDEYHAVAARLLALLAADGARLDGVYVCPHAPEIDGACDCRKPGVRLYTRAAADLGLDLSRSWWIGDRVTDLLPSAAFGGKGVLLLTGLGPEFKAEAEAKGFPVVAGLPEAVGRVGTGE
jgi:histidinol-phosphate phosphatase family protein